jgi:hypothetical protein
MKGRDYFVSCQWMGCKSLQNWLDELEGYEIRV